MIELSTLQHRARELFKARDGQDLAGVLGLPFDRRVEQREEVTYVGPMRMSRTLWSITYTIHLDHRALVQASFSPEGLRHKLVKLFVKELQTGDAGFDKAIYISTNTPDETALLLQCEGVREAIQRLVGEGGEVCMEEEVVTIRVGGQVSQSSDPGRDDVSRVLAALLALRVLSVGQAR